MHLSSCCILLYLTSELTHLPYLLTTVPSANYRTPTVHSRRSGQPLQILARALLLPQVVVVSERRPSGNRRLEYGRNYSKLLINSGIMRC